MKCDRIESVELKKINYKYSSSIFKDLKEKKDITQARISIQNTNYQETDYNTSTCPPVIGKTKSMTIHPPE